MMESSKPNQKEVLEARAQLEETDELVEYESPPVITAVYSLGIEHKCSKCIQTFPTSNEALDHENQHGENWPCRLCPAAFKTKETLLHHRRLAHFVDERYILFDIPSTTTTAANSRKSVNSTDTLPDVPSIKVPNFLTCLECNKTFRNSYQKAVHDKNAHKNLNGFKYKCFDCFQGFENQSQWKIHQNAHKKNKFVRCPLCPKIFKTSQAMQSHKNAIHGQSHSNEKVNNCPKCDEVFSTTRQLTDHEKGHGDKYPCDLCPSGFKKFETVLKHRKKFHPDATTKYDFQPPASTFKCRICNPIREFITSTELSLHIQENHKDTFQFQCSKCDEKFPTLVQKFNHEKSHPISCTQCHQIFYGGNQALVVHKARYHPIKVNCSKCDEIFTTENARDIHETVHGDDWPCLLCPAGFRSRYSVLKHRKKYHPEAEEYTFETNVPDSTLNIVKDVQREVQKSESTLPKLKNKKIYQYEKIYKCKKCPTAYVGKLELRKHMKSHGMEWICEFCSVGYKSQIGLLCHRKAVHPEAKKYRWKKEKQEKNVAQPTGNKVPCGLCPAVLPTVRGANAHRRMIHWDLSTSRSQVSDTFTVKDPSSFVSVSMVDQDVKPDKIFETSEKNEESKRQVNPEEIFVKPELEKLIWFESEME